jgi:hypothetical protein
MTERLRVLDKADAAHAVYIVTLYLDVPVHLAAAFGGA